MHTWMSRIISQFRVQIHSIKMLGYKLQCDCLWLNTWLSDTESTNQISIGRAHSIGLWLKEKIFQSNQMLWNSSGINEKLIRSWLPHQCKRRNEKKSTETNKYNNNKNGKENDGKEGKSANSGWLEKKEITSNPSKYNMFYMEKK